MIRIRPRGSDSPVEDGRHALADVLLVDRRQPESVGRSGQPLEVAGEREGLVVDDLDRLEHPVADRESVVGDRHRGGLRIVEQTAVDPHAHAPRLGREEARHASRTSNWSLQNHRLWFSFAPPGSRWSQADVAQLVERNLAKVEVASSSLVVRSEKPPRNVGLHGGLAERRGNGLQIRVHGFKSRTHLETRSAPPSATPEGDWRSGSALP